MGGFGVYPIGGFALEPNPGCGRYILLGILYCGLLL